MKSSRSLKIKINEELTCGICHDLLHLPKILTQCSHTFCQKCLHKLFTFNRTRGRRHGNHEALDQLECPKCRQITVLPQGRVAALPTNCTLQSMAEIISAEPDDQPECEPQPVCKEHEGILDQYCSACNELLCSECIHDPKHKEHLLKGEIHLAHKILSERLNSLSEKLQPAASLVAQAREMKQQVDKKKESIASNCKETKGEIEVFFKQVKKHLEDTERSLISAVEQNANMKLAVLEEHSQMLEESKMSAVKATEAINRFCQTRDIHSLTEDQTISEDIQQCQQSLEKLDAELCNPDLNLILKFKEDTSLESQLSTLGKLTECKCDASLCYLTVEHQLTVGRDGKVFKDSPAPATVQTQYLVLAEGNESYTEYGRPRSASNPNLGRFTTPCPPHSPTTGRLYGATYYAVPPSKHGLLPQQSPSENPQRFLKKQNLPIRPLSCGDEVFREPHEFNVQQNSSYDYVEMLKKVRVHALQPSDRQPIEINLPQNTSDSDNDDDIYAEIYDDAYTPQPSDLEGEYEVMSECGPPLPPDNATRSLTRPIPPPRNRSEPIIIEPVQIISTQQLCHTSCNDKVHPVGIQCASGSDNIMITDIHNHCLRQLDKDGSLVQTIGSEGRDDGQFKEPTALAIGAGFMYATDLATNDRVQKFSKYGQFVDKFGKRRLRKPYGVAISQKDQSVYISDCRKRRVYIYDRNCKYVGSIGKAEVVTLHYPVGIAFDTAGNLLVLDGGQQCACIWQIDISKPKEEVIAKIGEGYLHRPFGITVTQDGSIVVTEQGNLNCVSVFSSRGELIQCFGKTGSKPGMFNRPSGVTVNSKGQIIVADTYNQRLQIFSLHKEEC